MWLDNNRTNFLELHFTILTFEQQISSYFQRPKKSRNPSILSSFLFRISSKFTDHNIIIPNHSHRLIPSFTQTSKVITSSCCRITISPIYSWNVSCTAANTYATRSFCRTFLLLNNLFYYSHFQVSTSCRVE